MRIALKLCTIFSIFISFADARAQQNTPRTPSSVFNEGPPAAPPVPIAPPDDEDTARLIQALRDQRTSLDLVELTSQAMEQFDLNPGAVLDSPYPISQPSLSLGVPGIEGPFGSLEHEAQLDLNRGDHTPDPFAASMPSAHELIQIAKNPQNHIVTADDFLGYLKRRYPGFFQKPVWMYDSESGQQDAVNNPANLLQGASVTDQDFRAIAHYGRTILGVVFDPNSPLYNQIELVEALPEGGYKYRRLNFPPGAPGGQPLNISKESACTRCHGDPPHPIWGTYPLWPGAIGGSDDDFISAHSEGHLREYDHLEKLSDKLRGGGRYALFRPENDFDLRFPRTHNSDFTELISTLAFHEMMKSLENSKDMYKKYKYAIYGTLNRCADIPGFLPRELQQQHERRLGMGYQGLVDDTKRITRAEYDARRDRFLALNQETRIFGEEDESPVALGGEETMAALRYLLEGQNIDPHFNMRAWALSRAPGPDTFNYNMTTPTDGGPSDFFRKVFWATAQTDPDFTHPSESCADLRRKSLTALAPGAGGEPPRSLAGGPPINAPSPGTHSGSAP